MWRSILTLAIVANLIHPAFAQPVTAVENVGRNRPVLLPRSEGPRGRVNDLRFVEHNGSIWLLAGSSDKLVHRWELQEKGTLVPAPPLHWPVFRGIRGSIYTLADVGRGQIAVAGVGVKSSQVSILSLDAGAPRRRLVDVTQARQNVWTVTTSGRRDLLFVGEGASANGRANLLVWELESIDPKVVCCTTSLSAVKHLAVSPNDEYLVAAGPLVDDPATSAVLVWRVSALREDARQPNEGTAVPVEPLAMSAVFPETGGREAVCGVGWLDDDTWIAGTTLGFASGSVGGRPDRIGFERQRRDGGSCQLLPGLVYDPTPGGPEIVNSTPEPVRLFDTSTKREVTLSPDQRRIFRAPVLWRREHEDDFGPITGRALELVPFVVDLDAADGHVLSSIWLDGRVRVYLQRPNDDGPRPFAENELLDVTAMALSPDGRFAAAAGPALVTVDDRQVAVHRIHVWSTEGRALARTLETGLPEVGGPIAEIATSRQKLQDTIVVRYGNAPVFASPDAFRAFPGGNPFSVPVDGPEADIAFAAKAVREFPSAMYGTNRGDVSIDQRDVRLLEYFMNKRDDPATRVGPFFTTPGNTPRCCVTFRSNDREYAAVGMADGVHVWDLGHCADGIGYRALVRAFHGHDAPITSIDVSSSATQLYSASLDGTICGWSVLDLGRRDELGLETRDDTVTKVAAGSAAFHAGFAPGMTVEKMQVQGLPVSKEAIPNRLSDPLPGLEHFFEVRLGRQTMNLQTPIAHDPLWTFYRRHDDQHVMWTPEGFHASNGRDGTKLVEWIVNLGGPLGQSDEIVVFPGVDHSDRLRVGAELDDVFRKGIRPKSEVPVPPSVLLDGGAAGARFEVSSTDAAQTIQRIELSINGHRVASSTDRAIHVDGPDLEPFLRSGRNTLAGIVTSRTNGRTGHFRRLLDFDHGKPARPRRMHFVGIAVARSRPGLTELETVVGDVHEISEAVHENRGRLARTSGLGFTDLGAQHVFLENPVPVRILEELDSLASNVAPDDVTIVVLSGHGSMDAARDEYVFHAGVPKGGGESLVRQAEIADRIARLPCRTLLLLDTCHAGGGAGNAREIEQFARVVNGPMVITACARDEQAYTENHDLGHGFFLAAVLEALRGGGQIARPVQKPNGKPIDLADTNEDGRLSVEEFGDYVRRRTAEIKQEYFSGSETQTPQVVPSVFFPDTQRTLLR